MQEQVLASSGDEVTENTKLVEGKKKGCRFLDCCRRRDKSSSSFSVNEHSRDLEQGSVGNDSSDEEAQEEKPGWAASVYRAVRNGIRGLCGAKPLKMSRQDFIEKDFYAGIHEIIDQFDWLIFLVTAKNEYYTTGVIPERFQNPKYKSDIYLTRTIIAALLKDAKLGIDRVLVYQPELVAGLLNREDELAKDPRRLVEYLERYKKSVEVELPKLLNDLREITHVELDDDEIWRIRSHLNQIKELARFRHEPLVPFDKKAGKNPHAVLPQGTSVVRRRRQAALDRASSDSTFEAVVVDDDQEQEVKFFQDHDGRETELKDGEFYVLNDGRVLSHDEKLYGLPHEKDYVRSHRSGTQKAQNDKSGLQTVIPYSARGLKVVPGKPGVHAVYDQRMSMQIYSARNNQIEWWRRFFMRALTVPTTLGLAAYAFYLQPVFFGNIAGNLFPFGILGGGMGAHYMGSSATQNSWQKRFRILVPGESNPVDIELNYPLARFIAENFPALHATEEEMTRRLGANLGGQNIFGLPLPVTQWLIDGAASALGNQRSAQEYTDQTFIQAFSDKCRENDFPIVLPKGDDNDNNAQKAVAEETRVNRIKQLMLVAQRLGETIGDLGSAVDQRRLNLLSMTSRLHSDRQAEINNDGVRRKVISAINSRLDDIEAKINGDHILQASLDVKKLITEINELTKVNREASSVNGAWMFAGWGDDRKVNYDNLSDKLQALEKLVGIDVVNAPNVGYQSLRLLDRSGSGGE